MKNIISLFSLILMTIQAFANVNYIDISKISNDSKLVTAFNFVKDNTKYYEPVTNPVYITGHIKRNPKDTFAYVDHIIVFVKGDNKVLAKTITDNNGNFNLKFTPKQEKSFDFFCKGVGLDTLLVGSVKVFKSDTPDMTFYIPIQYKKSFFGKVICPKCNKADKVVKVEYGFPSYIRHIDENGDTTLTFDNRGYQA